MNKSVERAPETFLYSSNQDFQKIHLRAVLHTTEW